MKSTCPIAISLSAALAFSAPGAARFAAYEECAPGAVRPAGHLAEFLRREADGMLGHRERLGYPFDTGLWSGPMKSIHFTEGVYNGDDEDRSDSTDWWNAGAWWPFEQTAYLLDAMARTGALMDVPAIDAEYKKSFDAVVAHQQEDGNLFRYLSNSDSEWPFVVFFRSAWSWAERKGDAGFWEAVRRHYDCKKDRRRRWQGRDALNIEGMLRLHDETGDRTLVDDAVACWEQSYHHRFFAGDTRVHDHGVSFAEELKIPAELYIYTGDGRYLEEAKRTYRNAVELNEQASGQISCNEFLSGKDPRQGYESCVCADMMWSLGWFLRADGDVDAADRMEMLAYNVLPGAITKDFRRHQYLSSVNQVACTPFSQSSHFNYGESTWRQYRPAHFPQCCTGNILRALPGFLQRMWMKDAKDGHPVAMLHGPGSMKGVWKGVEYEIREETEYPFEEEVRFVVAADRPLEMPLTYRVPKWADRPDAGTLVAVDRVWKPGERFAVRFPMKVRFHSDRNWHWFTYGPLALSYAVPSRVSEERPGDPFTPITVEPSGDWNFAVDVDEIAKQEFEVERCASRFQFESPSLVVKIPVHEIREWQVLDEQRFTPDPPLYAHPTGKTRTIELVPYATTLARITCFPDVTPRRQLPVVAAYTAGEPYDFDPSKPLAAQVYEPESWTDRRFRSSYKVPQRSKEMYFDLLNHFGPARNKLAYVLFRIWSDEDGEATFCVGAASRWQAFMDGREVASSGDGWVEGEMMAPFWFDHHVKKGYNYVLLKVATPGQGLGQYRREWGAKIEAFLTEGT
ncbi:MAG: glycoside hydrolase family 127 protein [Kiritimatiellae bacterium]|nr:glycoside hydrolase family 127 protein [Kiritimatiellia bacterium]